MTDISNFLAPKSESIEMISQINFEREGIKKSLRNRIESLEDQTRFSILEHGEHLSVLKTNLAILWSLVEKLEDCQNRIDGISECEAVKRRGSLTVKR